MASGEKREFLSEQLISYLGNKRSLLAPIERAICEIKAELGQGKISFADVFSGSGIVARLAKSALKPRDRKRPGGLLARDKLLLSFKF